MLSVTALTLIALPAPLPEPVKFPLTIESIMRGPALVGHAPRALRWSADGTTVGFSWAKADGTANPRYQNYTVKADGTGLKLGELEGVAFDSPPADRGSKLDGRTVYEDRGDLYLYNESTKESKRLTETSERESNPRLLDGGQAIVFSSGESIYRLDIGTGAKTELVSFQTDEKEGQTPSSAPGAKPAIVRIPSGLRRGVLSISPSGTHASMDLSLFPTGGRRADVPNYITRSGYPEMIPTFERVGGSQPSSKTWVVNLESGKVNEIAPLRTGRIGSFRWSSDRVHGIALARAEDNKDDWIVGFDTKADKATVLWTEHCDGWVGGPTRGVLGWYPDGSRFYFGSERNGFSSLLSMPAGGGDVKPIVEGKFEVSDVRLDAVRNRFTFVSSEGSPFIRHLDAVNLDASGKKKLADLSADEDMTYAIAPNGVDVAVVKSKPNRPAELFVGGKQVTVTPTEEWLSGPWIEPTVLQVPSTDGVTVASRLYKPKNWKKGGPGVIFVHGAGYLQNVYDGWSHYYREYMFHHYLMEQGYAVLDMDYRASAGYGRDWRTAIYRHMGGKDLDDIMSGAKWLVDKEGVAKDRLGIYGGSYGGFITFMAMFTKPGTFVAGAALRPVSDWSSYNHGYTAPILNVPQVDAEAYKQSSPINFVEGLQGALLICHGMVDTNVPFQDSVRVAQRLIELGKKNWELAPYPTENHDFQSPTSWTDEYTRIFNLFERTIGSKRH